MKNQCACCRRSSNLQEVNFPVGTKVCDQCFAQNTCMCDHCGRTFLPWTRDKRVNVQIRDVDGIPVAYGPSDGEVIHDAPLAGEEWCRSCIEQHSACCDACRVISALGELTEMGCGLLWCSWCRQTYERIRSGDAALLDALR